MPNATTKITAACGLTLALAACAHNALGAPPTPLDVATESILSFEEDAIGAVPNGFTVAETNGKGALAKWRVTDGLDPHDPGHIVMVETANTGSTFNLLLSDAVYPADLTVSVYIYPRRGEEDQGGGLVWRARDAANYYVARWNPLEDNVRLYTVVDGKRALLESADVMARPGVWHQLTATMQGDKVTLLFDGKPCLEWRDTTLGEAGRIGLWTKADATTLFDRIEVKAP